MDTRDPRFSGLSIGTGVVRYSDLSYLITTNDAAAGEGYTDSLLFSLDRGNWGAGTVEWLACSGTVCHVPTERYLVLGTDGSVQASGGGAVKEEAPIASCGVDPRNRGPLREVRGIAKGRAYAVGTCRQAYVRDGEGQWKCVDWSAQVGDTPIIDTSFESIDGFSEQEIYTVGWEGEIWKYDGSFFTQQNSPTNLALYKFAARRTVLPMPAASSAHCFGDAMINGKRSSMKAPKKTSGAWRFSMDNCTCLPPISSIDSRTASSSPSISEATFRRPVIT